MSEHVCPSCRELRFTWHLDDDGAGGETTWWLCSSCRYVAQEDESQERPCQHCAQGLESRLTDEHRVFWWCHRCRRTTTVSVLGP